MVKIRSVMSKEIFAVAPGSSTVEAASLISSKSVSMLVVKEKNKPIAVISERDVITGILNKKTKVSEIMSKDFEVISPNTKFHELSSAVRSGKYKRFLVVENDNLIGVITETDIIEATRDFTRIDQIVQEVILAVFGLATAFFFFYFSPLRISIFGP